MPSHHHSGGTGGAHEEEVLGKAYDARLMRRLLTYLKPYQLQVVLALLAIVLKAGADVLGPYLTKTAIDKYLAHKAGEGHSFLDPILSSQPLTGVAQIGLIYIGLLSFSFLLEFAQTYLMQWTGQKVMFDLRSQIYRHLQHMHIGFFDRNPVGRLVTRVTTDVDALNEMFTSGVVAIFEDVFVLAGIIAIMFNMSWRLALIAMAVLPLIYMVTAVFRKHVRDSYRRIRVAIARINAYLQEHVTGIAVLQLFNREQRAYAEFKAINASHMLAFKDAILAYAYYYPVVEILSATAMASILWYGGSGVLSRTLTLGVVVAFMQYAQRFFRPIQDLSEKYNILQSAMASSERIFKLLDTKPEITSPPAARQPDGPGRIEFDHVWFAYRRISDRGKDAAAGRVAQAHPSQVSAATSVITDAVEAAQTLESAASPSANGASLAGHANPASRTALAEDAALITANPETGIGSDHGSVPSPQATEAGWDWVLRDVCFTLEPGETAAVVGHTGAGKTTLISLLLRFYDVQQGSIRLDGVDIREFDLQALRRRFGVVLQDPFLFSGTVETNIRLGSEIDAEAIERATEEVNLAEFIRSLPDGLQSHMKERGSTLSTGQKQLISFARALAHNPKILVLDEATSSVDTETEFRVREALTRMVEGRTSLIIAHRLSTIQRASNIIVMHKGKVREMGSHQQLLAQRGIYYRLYQLQYKDQEIPSVLAVQPDPAPREVGAND